MERILPLKSLKRYAICLALAGIISYSTFAHAHNANAKLPSDNWRILLPPCEVELAEILTGENADLADAIFEWSDGKWAKVQSLKPGKAYLAPRSADLGLRRICGSRAIFTLSEIDLELKAGWNFVANPTDWAFYIYKELESGAIQQAIESKRWFNSRQDYFYQPYTIERYSSAWLYAPSDYTFHKSVSHPRLLEIFVGLENMGGVAANNYLPQGWIDCRMGEIKSCNQDWLVAVGNAGRMDIYGLFSTENDDDGWELDEWGDSQFWQQIGDEVEFLIDGQDTLTVSENGVWSGLKEGDAAVQILYGDLTTAKIQVHVADPSFQRADIQATISQSHAKVKVGERFYTRKVKMSFHKVETYVTVEPVVCCMAIGCDCSVGAETEGKVWVWSAAVDGEDADWDYDADKLAMSKDTCYWDLRWYPYAQFNSYSNYSTQACQFWKALSPGNAQIAALGQEGEEDSLDLEIWDEHNWGVCEIGGTETAQYDYDYQCANAEVKLQGDCSHYDRSQDARFNFWVDVNSMDRFESTVVCYDLEIYDADKNLVRVMRREGCAEGPIVGAKLSFEARPVVYQNVSSWDFLDEDGNPVPAGNYSAYARFFVLSQVYCDPIVSVDFSVGEAEPEDPGEFTICHADQENLTFAPTEQAASWSTIQVEASALPEHLAHGDYIGVCEEEPEPEATLCHIPPGNPEDAQTITVGESAVAAHLAHGDYLGECDAEPEPEPEPVEIAVCHVSVEDPTGWETLYVSEENLTGHLEHGDYEGECESEPVPDPNPDPDPDPAAEVTLCHLPPGNPENAQTITVGESAVQAHLAHGNYQGECQTD